MKLRKGKAVVHYGHMKHTVLIADDDEGFLSVCRQFLERADFNVIEAHDGDEVLALIAGATEKPHALVLDVAMPRKDGLTVMKEVRQTEWGKQVPIIILTAKDPDDERMKEISEWAPTYYFVKGNERFENIVEKIQEAILERENS